MNRIQPPASNQRELAIKFKVIKFLGKGSYGSVFQVQRLGDGKNYALKEMDVRSMSQVEREDSVNEIRLLASVQHPNVINYNEAFLDGNRLCIIMEYAPDGDLAKVIKKQQMLKRPMPEEQVWKFFIQIAMGLQALHGMRILHRDIKPGNIMVMDDGVAKIGDLGIAKLLTKTLAAKTQIGTPHYMPPEVWRNKPYSFSSDTWALGCLLYEMATCSVPFEARSMAELRNKVLRGTFPAVPSTFSKELIQMVKECLDPNPDRRPSMDTILASPAVASRIRSLPGDLGTAPPSTAGSALISTIKVPRNFQMIKKMLPPASYATDMMNMNSSDEYEEEGGADILQLGKMAAAYPSTATKPAIKPYGANAGIVNSVLNGNNIGGNNGAGGRAYGQQGGPANAAASRAAAAPVGAVAKLPLIPQRSQVSFVQASSQPPSQPSTPPQYPQRPPPIQAPPPPLYSLADQQPWQVKGNPTPSVVSESHASYGAFYHHSQGSTPTAGAPAQQPQWHQPVSPYMQQKQAELQQQQQRAGVGAGQQYNLPALGAFNQHPQQKQQYMSPAQQLQAQQAERIQAERAARALQYQQQVQQQAPQRKELAAANPAGARPYKLPSLAQQHQQLMLAQAQAKQAAASKSPPPWNAGFGIKQQKAAAGMASAAAVAAKRARGEQENHSNMPRYPPPQWQGSRW